MAQYVFLGVMAGGCQGLVPTATVVAGSGSATPHVTAVTQVIASGPGTVAASTSGLANPDAAFGSLDSLLPGAPGPTQVQQTGPMVQVTGPGGTQQVIHAAPNPATNLGGFLGSVFNQVGIGSTPPVGGVPQPGIQQGIVQSSQSGSGVQQSLSMGSGGNVQQQTVTNADGTVSVLRSGPAGNGVWRSESLTYRQGDQQNPLRSVISTVSRDGDCREVTRTRTLTQRPDGTMREALAVRSEDTCTGDSLGEVRAQVRTVDGQQRLVGSVIRPDGTVQGFSQPFP